MKKQFHFTIDCDWIPNSQKSLPKIFELTEKYKLSPTFFITGKFALQYGEYVKEMAIRNYQIGAHGWAHGIDAEENFGINASFDVQKKLLIDAAEAIEKVSGIVPQSFRAPRLEICETTFRVLEELKFEIDSSIPARRFDFGFGSNNSISNLFKSSGSYSIGNINEITPSAFVFPLNMRFIRKFGARAGVNLFNFIKKIDTHIVFYLHPAELVNKEELIYSDKECAFYQDCGARHFASLEHFIKPIACSGIEFSNLSAQQDKRK